MINIQPFKNLSDYPVPYRDYLIKTKLDAMKVMDELEEHLADLVDDDIQEIHQQIISDNDLNFEE